MTDRYLTTAQVAERLGVARPTVEGWRCRGGGPAFVKLGDSGPGKRPAVRYAESALVAWLAAQTVGGAA